MYPRPQQPQETTLPTRGLSNGQNSMPPQMNHRVPAMGGMQPAPMPDLLAQAFNQAIQPYTEKIEQLEQQLADMQAWVDQLEQQRAEVHGWIDKRGLRPGMFISINSIIHMLIRCRRPSFYR
jgi:TolA-binding protein